MVYAGQEPPAETEPKFNPFTGVGRRLDGKPLKTQSPPASSSGSQDKRTNVSSGGGSATASSSSSQSTNRQSQGKLVFGSNANRTRQTEKVSSRSLLQMVCSELLCVPLMSESFVSAAGYCKRG